MHKVVIRAIRFLPLLVLLLITVQIAPATQVWSFTDYFGPYLDTFNTDPDRTLPKFNPALGTLTAVVFTLSAELTGIGTVTNTGASTGTISTDQMIADVVLTSPFGLYSEVVPIYTAAGPPLPSPNKYWVTSGSTVVKSGTSNTIADTQTITAGLGNYMGPGTFTYDLDVQSSRLSNIPTGWPNSSHVTTTGFARIEYIYEETGIPEPATLAMMGGALLGLGVFGRKYSRRRV